MKQTSASAIVETRASTQAPTGVWLFWGTLVAYWLVSLQFRALIHPDEGRYATLAMGMQQSGDWKRVYNAADGSIWVRRKGQSNPR